MAVAEIVLFIFEQLIVNGNSPPSHSQHVLGDGVMVGVGVGVGVQQAQLLKLPVNVQIGGASH